MKLTDEQRVKIKSLPKWAQEIIYRLETANEPAIEEVVRQRKIATDATQRADRLRDANSALMELLGTAGRGGLDWAATTVNVLEGYEIFQDIHKKPDSEKLY